MKTDKCLQDPVFQLNLLLWMAKDQPRDNEFYRVRPLFRELGYDIHYVENPFSFPEITRKAIEESEIDISQKPEPDLVLRDQDHRKALYFEAKKQSFGPSSSTARQARGHLIATGPAFSEVYMPLKSCLLCYVLPSDDRDDMQACLNELSRELSENSLAHGPFSIHGLSYRDARVMYSLDAVFKRYTGFGEDECSLIEEVAEDTDPCPLLLVFSDDDCSNNEDCDFYRRAMIEQVRACLLCELHPLAVSHSYEITADKLLDKTTDGIFSYLGRLRQKGLRKLVQDNVLSEIAKHWSDKQTGVRMSDGTLTVFWRTSGEKDAFLERLEDRNTSFVTSKPSDDPQMLIEDIPQLSPSEES